MRIRPSLRTGRLFAVLLILIGLTVVGAGPARAAGGSAITGVGSHRCLDVPGRTHTAGTQVIIWDCNNQDNQTWTLTPAGQLQVYDTATCLDVRGRSTTAGARAQIYACNGGDNQRFVLHPDGTITGVQSGLCLDVTSAATAGGSLVQMWTCNGGSNQKWTSTLSSPDTTPPTVPANPRVADLTCRTVTLAWDAATDNVGVSAYDVYHDGQLITSVAGSTLSTQLTVVAGVTWRLYVNARDAAGNVSQASANVPITPPQCQTDTQPPTAPTGLTGTVGGTSVMLHWTASTDNVGVRYYDILRGGVKVGTVAGNPPATTFTDSGLAPGTAYTWTVTARDAQGNSSPAGNAVTLTTAAACADPVCAVTTVATETDIPWGVATLADGSVLYTRRDTHELVHLDPATGTTTAVGVVPNVSGTDGEGGLLGLALSPTFATDHWLYLMHTSPTDNRIVRIQYLNGALATGTEQILLTGIGRNVYHNGGRLRFGPDGKLYASTGDAQNGDNAQNLNSLNGKVLRLNPDGTVPTDNPFHNYVWSYGHRNPQGLAFDSQGRLWEQEFGNSVMDETNLIVKGGNYGWPGCEGTTGTCGTAGLIAPKHTYPTADGSCSGIAIVKDVLYVACERGTRMYREVISGDTLTDVQTYFNGTYGRLRTVEPAPDGGLWLTTTNDGDKDSTPNNSNNKFLHVALGG